MFARCYTNKIAQPYNENQVVMNQKLNKNYNKNENKIKPKTKILIKLKLNI